VPGRTPPSPLSPEGGGIGGAARADSGAPGSRRTATPRSVAPTPQATAPAPPQATMTLEPAPAPRPRRTTRKIAWAIAAGVLLALSLPTGLAVARWLEERPLRLAAARLAAGDPEAARDLLARAVLLHPDDARLRVLQGRALHQLPDEIAAGLEAYSTAIDLDPASLGPEARADLARDLGGEPAIADRAASLLARVGAPAFPALVRAAGLGTGAARLRALDLLRQLGGEGQLDLVGAHLALLDDEDCDVRREVTRRLAELGSAAAIPRLTELAQRTREIHGLLGKPQRVPACGAAEAREALAGLRGR
jgi:hypothetical protein